MLNLIQDSGFLTLASAYRELENQGYTHDDIIAGLVANELFYSIDGKIQDVYDDVVSELGMDSDLRGLCACVNRVTKHI